MKNLLVKVTWDDIRRGIRTDGTYCPIARAVRRLGRKKAVSVTGMLRLGDIWFTLPPIADTFMLRFDTGKPVKPFSFIAKRYD